MRTWSPANKFIYTEAVYIDIHTDVYVLYMTECNVLREKEKQLMLSKKKRKIT